MFRDAKYLLAYVPVAAVFLSVIWAGAWSFSGWIVAFVFIPIMEFFAPQSTKNLTPTEEQSKLSNVFFDFLLYLNIPLLYIIIWLYFSKLSAGGLEFHEIIGMTMSVGIVMGSIGINVAHELGHRVRKYEQTMSKMLLLSTLYMHFFIEHNRGHHLNVATDEDPASSRKGEIIYTFWFRSIINSYIHAWQLENQRLRRAGKNILHWSNEMIWYHIIEIGYLVAVGLVFGWMIVPFAIAIALGGVLQLESVNYIEHYGLRRKKLANGRYENVQPHHSWNSNHELGRIFLYELTRHSDHHFKATRKYQVLRHFDEAPQLPTGYPGAIWLSLIPPLWFKVMDKRLEKLAV